jgi:hypothetical protein
MTQSIQKKQRARKKPLGSPVDWTESDLDALSTISPADLKAAAALWRNEAPKPLQGLLDAKVQEEAQGNG